MTKKLEGKNHHHPPEEKRPQQLTNSNQKPRNLKEVVHQEENYFLHNVVDRTKTT